MIDLQEESVLSLIKMYCRESGVRNLQKHIEKVGLCPVYWPVYDYETVS